MTTDYNIEEVQAMYKLAKAILQYIGWIQLRRCADDFEKRFGVVVTGIYTGPYFPNDRFHIKGQEPDHPLYPKTDKEQMSFIWQHTTNVVQDVCDKNWRAEFPAPKPTLAIQRIDNRNEIEALVEQLKNVTDALAQLAK